MRRVALLIIVLTFAALLGCNNSGIGILYSISEEKALVDNDTLPNELSVTGMVVLSDVYYLSAGSLFQRGATEAATADWSIVDPPDATNVFCVQLTSFGGALYGIFASMDGSTSTLFTMTPGGGTWSAVSAFTGKLVDGIVATASTVIVTERDGTDYITYSSSDGATYNSISLSGQYVPVADVAEYGGFTWLASGKHLFNNQTGSYEAYTSGPTTTAGFGGVHASATLNVLFVTSREGNVYAYDGSAWFETAVADDDGDGIPLHDLAEITILGEPVILVGSDVGYYEIFFVEGYTSTFAAVGPGDDSYSSSDENYQKVPLRSGVVRFFIWDNDSDRQTIFACTSGEGLWINPIDDSDSNSVIRKWDRQ